MYRHLITFLCMGLLMFTGACCQNKCSKTPEAPAPTKLDHEISTVEISTQNNSFAFELLHQVDKEGQNLLFSPFSINSAMGMAYTGAKGNTAAEMAKVMDYAYSPEQQHYSFNKSQEILKTVKERKRAQLDIANAMFSADTNKSRLVPGYLQTLQKSFDSELVYLDFSQAKKSADFINTWVEKQTNDRIKDIVTERQIADSKDGLVLVNSIYFKSAWLTPFSRKSTKEDKFYTTSQREKESYIMMPMMQQKGDFNYAELPEGQIIEMFFEDYDLSMVFMLPKDIDAASKDLNKDTWQTWMKHLNESHKVEVILPRFRLEQSLEDLPETFKAMGMHDAFSAGKADFTGILAPGKDNIYISDIVHKAFLEVLEEGTEAAAATQIGFAKTSFRPPADKVPIFRADKPFLCMIIHKEDNTILFAAKVVKPEAVKE